MWLHVSRFFFLIKKCKISPRGPYSICGDSNTALHCDAANLPVDLCPFAYPSSLVWGSNQRMRCWYKGQNELFPKVTGLPLSNRLRSLAIQEHLRVELQLFHTERSQVRWVGHLTLMPPGCLLGDEFWVCPTGRRPRRHTSVFYKIIWRR